MIIWLASYPRSGNTFFRLLLNHAYGVGSYSIYNRDRRGPVGDIIGHQLMDRSLEQMAVDPKPHFVKTHEVAGEDHYPAIALVRDGRDALVSYAHFILAYERAGDPSDPLAYRQTLHDLIAHDASFGGWSANVLSWADRPATTLVKFEDLVRDPLPTLERARADIGQAVSGPGDSRRVPSFAELREQIPQFFRRGQVGAWQVELPEDLHELFWRRHGSAMDRFGYPRQAPAPVEAGRPE